MIRNKKQLTSYAGLDIREKQSGTSVKGKPRISKKGNRNLRKTLHFPAMTAVKLNQEHRELFHRIVNKTGIKMKGLVAVQRKLLELMYILYKTKTFYEVNFEENRAKIKKIFTLQKLTLSRFNFFTKILKNIWLLTQNLCGAG